MRALCAPALSLRDFAYAMVSDTATSARLYAHKELRCLTASALFRHRAACFYAFCLNQRQRRCATLPLSSLIFHATIARPLRQISIFDAFIFIDAFLSQVHAQRQKMFDGAYAPRLRCRPQRSAPSTRLQHQSCRAAFALHEPPHTRRAMR